MLARINDDDPDNEKYWNQYCNNLNTCIETYDDDTKYKNKYVTYTAFYFEKYHLETYFNTNHQQLLQLGAYRGDLLKKYKEKGWQVMGYEFNDKACKFMVDKNIDCKNINLNACSENPTAKKHALDYQAQLKSNLSQPTHIVAVRILAILKPEAFNLLMFSLIENTKPGSILILIESCLSLTKEQAKEMLGMRELTNENMKKHPVTNHSLPENYIGSFYGPRTDIELLFSTKQRTKDHLAFEEIRVMRKLSV